MWSNPASRVKYKVFRGSHAENRYEIKQTNKQTNKKPLQLQLSHVFFLTTRGRFALSVGKGVTDAVLLHKLYTKFIKMAATRLKLGPSTSARHFKTALESTMASDEKKSNSNVNCCVLLCNQKGTVGPEGQKVGFFSFPPKRKVREVWLAEIRRDEGEYFKVKDTTTVCSLRFELSEIKKGFILVIELSGVQFGLKSYA